MEKDSLFTDVKIAKSNWEITHQDNILLAGSCFTDEIGNKLINNGFNVMKNPFGVIYNPLSIADLIIRVAENKAFTEKDVIKSGEFYYLFAAHGDIRGETEEKCLDLANSIVKHTRDFLKNTSVIIITLGTAWSYWYKSNGYLMANCHKVPQQEISRRLLQIDETENSLNNMIKCIKSSEFKVKHCLFTVSPVRHIKEGFYDNKLSKAVLHLAIDKIIKNGKNCTADEHFADYFPAYEIVMDCLRDYRFYARDLVHINETAVDYIWNEFSQTYFSASTREINEKYYKLYLMKNHRPFNPNSEGYRKHLQKIEQLEKELSAR